MKSSEYVHEPRTIKLSSHQAEQLVVALEATIQQLQGQPAAENLRVLHAKLDDASWLAHWLRNYVNLDVSADEALNLVEALLIHHDKSNPEPT